jgi:hypothetical protein
LPFSLIGVQMMKPSRRFCLRTWDPDFASDFTKNALAMK